MRAFSLDGVPFISQVSSHDLKVLNNTSTILKLSMNSYNSEDGLQGEVTGCNLAKLYFISWARNAFNWTMSSKYPGEDAFWPTLEDAQRHAEKLRVQGARFFIDELPAVVFPMTNICLIVTEINTPTPLERFFGRRPASSSVSDVAEFFEPRRENTVQRLLLYNRDASAPILPFRRYTSRPQGQKCILHWTHAPLKDLGYETKYVEAMVADMRRWFQELEQLRNTDEEA